MIWMALCAISCLALPAYLALFADLRVEVARSAISHGRIGDRFGDYVSDR